MDRSQQFFYEVFVATNRHVKDEPLTYSSPAKLNLGDVVIVPFGKREILGFVVSESLPPDFVTKPISRAVDSGQIPKKSVELFKWLLKYYPGSSGASAQLFLPSGLLVDKTPEIKKPKKPKLKELPSLTKEQQAALQIITKSKSKRFMLHGETGSGKTRVYIERAKYYLKLNESVLILTPEIALVPQLKEAFINVFGEQVVVMHSELTAKKRREVWLRIASSKEALVVIGARSALFSPIENLGLVVVDEFHEPAYKQEQAPRYQGLRVAGALAGFHKCEIIYGSATPLVAEYYLAEVTKTPIIRMDKPASGELTEVSCNLLE